MEATLAFPLLVGLIGVALLFDFLNGLHDAANSIATIVSTRVLRPQYAVFWAAFFNFIAFLFFGLHVAETVGKGIIDRRYRQSRVVFAALIGAIIVEPAHLVLWHSVEQLACADRRPVGAGVAKAGMGAIVWSGLLKTTAAIVLSPATGFVLALLLVLIVSWSFVKDALRRRPYLPHHAVHLGLALFARPWRQ
jgi:PiT family inorganic phosphate transporter